MEGAGARDAAVAGATAGLVTRAATQPFDVLKIRLQLQVEPVSRESAKSKYKALTQATQTILREEGLRGLWRGHTPAQALSISYGAIQFSAYEGLIKEFGDTGSSRFLAGAGAGTLATVLSFPFDVVRTRLVAQGNYKSYRWTGEGLAKLWRLEGLAGLTRGLTPTLLQAAPHSGTLFLVHNLMTRLNTHFGVESKIWSSLIAGSVAGVIGKSVIYPLDLSRKRLQLQGFQDSRRGFGKNFTCSGLINCLKVTYVEEGFRGFFKGLVPTWLKAASTTALYFTIYKETISYLSKR